MKRYCRLFLILVALVACSRKEPTPTNLPAPTLAASVTPMPSTTPTPHGSPVPRVSIVPSATRLRPAAQDLPRDTEAAPAGTAEPLLTPVPSATPTLNAIEPAATSTQPPTATLPESPLPTPSLVGPSPLPSPERETPPASTAEPTSSLLISTPSPTPEVITSTPTPTSSDAPTRTSTPTLSPTPQGEAWSVDKVFTYHDDLADELYIAGQVINNAGSSQRITSLKPVVYGPQGYPVTSAADFEFLPMGLDYGQLLESVSLAPGQHLAFGFRVSLPEGIAVEDNYEISVEAVPTELARSDIVTTLIESDPSGWPDFIRVECAVENPGPNLTDHLVITVSVYGEDDRLIGLGWRYETAPRYLAPGEQIFDVKAVMLEIVGRRGMDMNNVDVQAFGD